MKLLTNSTIPTLCGKRIDVKNADEITVREANFNPPSNLLANYKVYTEDLRTAEDNPERYTPEEIEKRKSQVNRQKEEILNEIEASIKYKPTAIEQTIKTIQNLSEKYKPEPIYFVIIIEYKVIGRHHEEYLIKIGNKDECEKFKEKLENRKDQEIKREGLQPAINSLTCILALIAAIGAMPTIVTTAIKIIKLIGEAIGNIAQHLN